MTNTIVHKSSSCKDYQTKERMGLLGPMPDGQFEDIVNEKSFNIYSKMVSQNDYKKLMVLGIRLCRFCYGEIYGNVFTSV